MKRSKFTEAQIAFVLKQVEDGASVAEVCRKAGIAEATFYNWRKKYGGLMPSEMKRLKLLDDGFAVAEQDAEASGQSQAARGSERSDHDQRDLGHGLRA